MNAFAQLLSFLQDLADNGIHYRLGCWRESISVEILAPDRYYEVEFFADAHVEILTWGPQSDVEVVPFDSLSQRVIQQIV